VRDKSEHQKKQGSKGDSQTEECKAEQVITLKQSEQVRGTYRLKSTGGDRLETAKESEWARVTYFLESIERGISQV
jgi:hypothetical protein